VESKFWLVTDLSYPQSVNLAASDLITNFDRDHRNKRSRFWPGTKGVLSYLQMNMPRGCSIRSDKGVSVED
jgi:hypothetical protein